jgi:hypothetical protein
MPTTEHTEIPIIDREQFDMLIATGEDEAASMLNELLELYTTEAEPKLKELHMMAALVDRHRCNRIAHRPGRRQRQSGRHAPRGPSAVPTRTPRRPRRRSSSRRAPPASSPPITRL